eukprot:gene8614-10223_t
MSLEACEGLTSVPAIIWGLFSMCSATRRDAASTVSSLVGIELHSALSAIAALASAPEAHKRLISSGAFWVVCDTASTTVSEELCSSTEDVLVREVQLEALGALCALQRLKGAITQTSSSSLWPALEALASSTHRSIRDKACDLNFSDLSPPSLEYYTRVREVCATFGFMAPDSPSAFASCPSSTISAAGLQNARALLSSPPAPKAMLVQSRLPFFDSRLRKSPSAIHEKAALGSSPKNLSPPTRISQQRTPSEGGRGVNAHKPAFSSPSHTASLTPAAAATTIPPTPPSRPLMAISTSSMATSSSPLQATPVLAPRPAESATSFQTPPPSSLTPATSALRSTPHSPHLKPQQNQGGVEDTGVALPSAEPLWEAAGAATPGRLRDEERLEASRWAFLNQPVPSKPPTEVCDLLEEEIPAERELESPSFIPRSLMTWAQRELERPSRMTLEEEDEEELLAPGGSGAAPRAASPPREPRGGDLAAQRDSPAGNAGAAEERALRTPGPPLARAQGAEEPAQRQSPAGVDYRKVATHSADGAEPCDIGVDAEEYALPSPEVQLKSPPPPAPKPEDAMGLAEFGEAHTARAIQAAISRIHFRT